MSFFLCFYQNAASVTILIFHLHVAEMKDSCQNLKKCHLATFIDTYNERE